MLVRINSEYKRGISLEEIPHSEKTVPLRSTLDDKFTNFYSTIYDPCLLLSCRYLEPKIDILNGKPLCGLAQKEGIAYSPKTWQFLFVHLFKIFLLQHVFAIQNCCIMSNKFNTLAFLLLGLRRILGGKKVRSLTGTPPEEKPLLWRVAHGCRRNCQPPNNEAMWLWCQEPVTESCMGFHFRQYQLFWVSVRIAQKGVGRMAIWSLPSEQEKTSACLFLPWQEQSRMATSKISGRLNVVDPGSLFCGPSFRCCPFFCLFRVNWLFFNNALSQVAN